jgi:hypothetical protein
MLQVDTFGVTPDEKIDESGSSNFSSFHISRLWHCINQHPGDFSRTFMQRLGQLHGEIAGVIAMTGLFCTGYFYTQRTFNAQRQRGLLHKL